MTGEHSVCFVAFITFGVNMFYVFQLLLTGSALLFLKVIKLIITEIPGFQYTFYCVSFFRLTLPVQKLSNRMVIA